MRRHRPVLAALLLLAAILLSAAPGYGQETAGQPTTCRIGVNIEDIYDIDIARDTFGAALWLWTLCPTDGVDPLATVALPTATSLNPSWPACPRAAPATTATSASKGHSGTIGT